MYAEVSVESKMAVKSEVMSFVSVTYDVSVVSKTSIVVLVDVASCTVSV